MNHQVDLFDLHPVSSAVSLSRPDEFSRTFAVLLEMWRDVQHPFREHFLSSYLQYLMAMVLQDGTASDHRAGSSRLAREPDPFAEVIRLMKHHPEAPWTLADLAQVVHLHPNYFHRAFKRAYGVTPREFLCSIRLNRAKELLDGSDDSLAHIATQCGMADVGYFSKWFRDWVGTSPRGYRKQARVEC